MPVTAENRRTELGADRIVTTEPGTGTVRRKYKSEEALLTATEAAQTTTI